MGHTRPFQLQGHRGARGLFPENTIEGFVAAWELGVRAFELDVGLTADDVVVVSHDPALNPLITRGPDGAWLSSRGPALRQMRWCELAAYDVGRIRPGTDYAQLYPQQVPVDGARIPRLADVLQRLPMAYINIEIKTHPGDHLLTAPPPVIADAVLDVIDAAQAVDRVMIESFDWRVPRHVRRHRPEIPLAWLTSPDTTRSTRLWWDGVDLADHDGSVPRAVAAEGGGTWAPHHSTLSIQALREATGLGLSVIPWTVNAADDMERLIRWGVDGLITDYPDHALRVLAALNRS